MITDTIQEYEFVLNITIQILKMFLSIGIFIILILYLSVSDLLQKPEQHFIEGKTNYLIIVVF